MEHDSRSAHFDLRYKTEDWGHLKGENERSILSITRLWELSGYILGFSDGRPSSFQRRWTGILLHKGWVR